MLSRARRRPVLYLLVYGAFVLVIGITATGQGMLASANFSASVMNAVVATDRSIIGSFVESSLAASDLGSAGSPSREAELRERLATALRHAVVQDSRVLRVDVRDPSGLVVLSDEAERRGMSVARDGRFEAALDGAPFADLAPGASAASEFGLATPAGQVIVEYLPIIGDGEVRAVVAVARDAEPIVARLDATRREVVLLTLAAAVIVAVLLFFIFRAAQNRITQQTIQLIEAARHDPLTGLLNHGVIVENLVSSIDAARPRGDPVAVALIDIDNFGLLNDTYGHKAGDKVLRRVATLLEERLAAPLLLGRFGPDEFLIVSPSRGTSHVESVVQGLRADLQAIELRFSSSERLPVTVSVGIASVPEHASAATELLSTATLALGEAKSGGGDAVRVADRSADERADARGFDVLRGLVLAVDTKDRYTKRHSEDVARYATFLGRQLGIDDELQSTIRLAGLLHDVGKVGIPDAILRKPGSLTPDEAAVVQQHVVLGDAIVRDLPNISTIRVGIRHHHERWDGNGYVDHLAGEEIPVIARILAVADAFSAMTTTRPYRRALPIREALDRLGGAAGTQLEEHLVKVFIAGIETAADAPLPGADLPAAQLWSPQLLPA